MSTGVEYSIIASKYNEADGKYHRLGLGMSILTVEELKNSIDSFSAKGFESEHIEITCYSVYDMENIYWQKSAKEWLEIMETDEAYLLNPFHAGLGFDLPDIPSEPLPPSYYHTLRVIDWHFNQNYDGSYDFELIRNPEKVIKSIVDAKNAGIALELAEVICFKMTYLAPYYGADKIEWRMGVEELLIALEAL